MSQTAQDTSTLQQYNVKMSSEFQTGGLQPIPGKKIEIVGEPNRPSTITYVERSGANILTKKGQLTGAEVNSFLESMGQIRGLPTQDSSDGEDVYGFGVQLAFSTDDIQWMNGKESGGFGTGPSSIKPTEENKKLFKQITDGIASLARTHAK